MAVGDAYVFPGSHTSTNTTSFQSHRLLFSHAFAEVRGKNTPERKVASTGDRTHNHQVMSPTRSPLSHPGGAPCFVPCQFVQTAQTEMIQCFQPKPWFLRICSTDLLQTLWKKEKLLVMSNFSFTHSVFYPIWWTFCHFHQI